jgi:predicted PurR-regulated permease PerM
MSFFYTAFIVLLMAIYMLLDIEKLNKTQQGKITIE